MLTLVHLRMSRQVQPEEHVRAKPQSSPSTSIVSWFLCARRIERRFAAGPKFYWGLPDAAKVPDHPPMDEPDNRFWETIPLTAMTPEQWDALCDGCAKCCLEKLEDEDTGRIHYTNVACKLLDLGTCRCGDYANRSRIVTNCITLTPAMLEKPRWLPATCAYRLIAGNRPLPDWHPLLSGDPVSVEEAGQSIYGRAISEENAGPLILHLVDWVE